MPQDRVDQLSVPLVLKQHADDLRVLKRYIGRWSYATPVAPATAPPGYTATDPLGVAFQPGVSNVPGEQPFRYRVHPASKVEIEGALNLGPSPSFPVLVCTLPGPGYGLWPTNPEPCEFPSTDSTAIWLGHITTSGQVLIDGPAAGAATPNLINVSGIDTSVYSDSNVTIPCDGAYHTISQVNASPPDYMDGSGNITEQGLYIVAAIIRVGTTPTTPGLYTRWLGPFAAQVILPLDAMVALGSGFPEDPITLLADDLPWSADAQIQTPTDITGTLVVRTWVAQLAVNG